MAYLLIEVYWLIRLGWSHRIGKYRG